jgi:hypothetical protein
MILVQESRAPSLQRMRPLRAAETPSFPVYPDLESRLLADEQPSDATAHALAVAAGYAYAEPDVVTLMLARMGLADNHCRTATMLVDPMFIRSTAHVVQSADGRIVIVAYRGTEPMSLINWLTDADVYPEKVRFDLPGGNSPVDIHAGFYRNVRATRFEVLSMLERARRGSSVLPGDDTSLAPMEALYLTGHSLGGAMASLLAVMLQTDPHFAAIAAAMRCVCTFGQPMVGSPGLAEACQGHPFLGSRLVRYVYRKDVVPHLPPRDSGRFRHVGVQRSFDGTRWSAVPATTQMTNLAGLLEMPASYLSRRIERLRGVPFRYSLDDHLPHHYIAALTPPGVPSEFGDAPYAPVVAK